MEDKAKKERRDELQEEYRKALRSDDLQHVKKLISSSKMGEFETEYWINDKKASSLEYAIQANVAIDNFRLLLHRGTKTVDGNNSSVLMSAVSHGRADIVTTLLTDEKRTQEQMMIGKVVALLVAAFDKAFKLDHIPVCQAMARCSKSVETELTATGKYLCKAVAANSPEMVEWLLLTMSIDPREVSSLPNEQNLLHTAAARRNPDQVLLLLLNLLANEVNAADKEGKTPLFVVRTPTAIPLLVNAGANPTHRDARGWLCVHEYCQVGATSAVEEARKHLPADALNDRVAAGDIRGVCSKDVGCVELAVTSGNAALVATLLRWNPKGNHGDPYAVACSYPLESVWMVLLEAKIPMQFHLPMLLSGAITHRYVQFLLKLESSGFGKDIETTMMGLDAEVIAEGFRAAYDATALLEFMARYAGLQHFKQHERVVLETASICDCVALASKAFEFGCRAGIDEAAIVARSEIMLQLLVKNGAAIPANKHSKYLEAICGVGKADLNLPTSSSSSPPPAPPATVGGRGGGGSGANAAYDLLLKMLLVGDSGVGKSCLLLRFTEDSFSSSFITTIGIDFKIKTVDQFKMKVKLQIWDTAGQERFRTITTAYYRGANHIFIVYDVTDEQSFLNVRNWMKQIETHGSDMRTVHLVGNKADIRSTRKVSFEQGLELAKELGIGFCECSAKDGIGVEQVFLNLNVRVDCMARMDMKPETVASPIARKSIPNPIVCPEYLIDLTEHLREYQNLPLPATHLAEKAECLIHGTIEKRLWLGWVQRYMVVVPPLLYRFKYQSDDAVREVADLSQIEVVCSGDVFMTLRSKVGNPDELYRFETRAERNRWMEALIEAGKTAYTQVASAAAAPKLRNTQEQEAKTVRRASVSGSVGARSLVELSVVTTANDAVSLQFLRFGGFPFFRTLMTVSLCGNVVFWDDGFRNVDHFFLSDDGDTVLLIENRQCSDIFGFLKQNLDNLLTRKKLDKYQRYAFFVIGYSTSCKVMKIPPCRQLLEDAVPRENSDEIQVDVHGARLGDRSSVALSQGIRYLRNISAFLGRNAFAAAGAGMLAVLAQLHQCPALAELDLSGNDLSHKSTVEILLKIIHNCPLTCLRLAACKFSPSQVVSVLGEISGSKSIEKLDIGHSPLNQDEAFSLLLGTVNNNKVLREIRAWDCGGVTEMRIEALQEAIAALSHPCIIDFGTRRITTSTTARTTNDDSKDDEAKDVNISNDDDETVEFGNSPSFSTSKFLELYRSIDTEPQFVHHVLTALEQTIFTFARQHQVDKAEARRMFKAMEAETMTNALVHNNNNNNNNNNPASMAAVTATLNQVQLFAVRMWTSAHALELPEGKRVEMCSMINTALRNDDPELLPSVTTLVRAINQLCVTKRSFTGTSTAKWPADFTTYRGGSLPEEELDFFTDGKKYRCPTLLATSSSKQVAIQFMQRAALPRVLWVIRMDPVYRCSHVNYIEEVSNVPGEEEFLFAAYSVFTVVRKSWMEEFHHWNVELLAAPDNKIESESLPLSTWS